VSASKRLPGTFDVVPRNMSRDCRMTAVAVRVVNYIASFGENAFPSYNTMGIAIGVHRSTAIRAVRLAAECGYLEITAQRDAKGDPTSNNYRVIFEVGGSASATTQSSENDDGSVSGATTVVPSERPDKDPLNESNLSKARAAAGDGQAVRRAPEEPARGTAMPDGIRDSHSPGWLTHRLEARQGDMLRARLTEAVASWNALAPHPADVVKITEIVDAALASAAVMEKSVEGKAPTRPLAFICDLAVAAIAECLVTLEFGREARRWCALAGEDPKSTERAFYQMLKAELFPECPPPSAH
jgi:hypothetical protein